MGFPWSKKLMITITCTTTTVTCSPYRATVLQELITGYQECFKISPKMSKDSYKSLEIFWEAVANCWTRTAESTSSVDG